MRSYKNILFVFISFWMVAAALAQPQKIATVPPTQSNAPNAAIAAIQAQANANQALATQEIAILKSQLEQHRAFQDAILNTVWWALGVLVAMTVVLIGASWFTNNHAYERDKIALRKELVTIIDGRLVEHSQLTNDRINAAQDQTAGQLATQKSETNQTISEARTDAEKSIDKATASLLREILIFHRQNQQEILALQSEFYASKGWLDIALQLSTYALRTALDRGDKFWIEHAIKGVETALEPLERAATPSPKVDSVVKIFIGVLAKYSAKASDDLHDRFAELKKRALALVSPSYVDEESDPTLKSD